ncbi:hypothetical protein HMI56_006332 [Coelomomyces lativittatus]|nr:hypothetical protein HMI56_006332 [Coelomomyces lativittatus]
MVVIVRKAKGKRARTKRFLEKREPKLIEGPKTTLLVRSSTTSALVNQVLADLHSLKSPYSVHFTKKNEIRPFDNIQPVEFLSQKNDASLILIGSHNKKRPHNLVFARTFDGQLLDMLEFGIQDYEAIKDISGPKCGVGLRPLLVFHGPWDTQPKLKSLFLDFFHGYTCPTIDLSSIQHAISLTYTESLIYVRSYTVNLKRSDEPTPTMELKPMGPNFNLCPRRSRLPDDALWKQAHYRPKMITRIREGKKIKNHEKNALGQVYGRLHFQKQNLKGLQLKKMKGLKKAITKIKETNEDENVDSSLD